MIDGNTLRTQHDIIDQPTKRAHAWIYIRLGRVCEHCLTAQATGDFDDDVVCKRRGAE